MEATIESSLASVRKLSESYDRMQVLVTGSLHLVGGAISLLQHDLVIGE